MRIVFELREYPEFGGSIPIDHFRFKGNLEEFIYFVKTHLALVDVEKHYLKEGEYLGINDEHPLVPSTFEGSVKDYIEEITKRIRPFLPKTKFYRASFSYIKDMALNRRAFISIHRDYYDYPGYAFLSLEGSPPKGFAVLSLNPRTETDKFSIRHVQLFPHGFLKGEIILLDEFETDVMEMLALGSYDPKIIVGIV